MIRSRLVCLKHIVLAVLTLVLLVCALEVGLHVYEISTERPMAEQAPADRLLVKSWLTYHSLKPMRTVTRWNPDTGEPVQVTTNSHGLRGPEIEVPKPPDVFRILCLGDESTLAAEIDEQKTFCALLQQYLQQRTRFRIEVLNAGVPDYCPLLTYLQIKHSLLGLQPDLLILNFDTSDVADDHRCRRHTLIGENAEPRTCPHPELLKSKKQPLQTRIIDRFLVTQWCRKQLEQIVPDPTLSEDRRDIHTEVGRYAWLKDNPPDWSIYIKQALSPIDHLKALSDRAYVRLIVSAAPAPWQVSGSASSGARATLGIPEGAVYSSELPISHLSEFLHERRIPFRDTSAVFANAPNADRLYLNNAPRFSEEGHELYARELAAFVMTSVSGIWEEREYDRNQQPPARHAQRQDPFLQEIPR